MSRARRAPVPVVSIVWILASVACTRERTSSPADQPPLTVQPEAEPQTGALPIVAVPQWKPSDPQLWVFEPGSKRMAYDGDLACGVWDVESGLLVRELEGDVESACEQWAPAVVPEALASHVSADQRWMVTPGTNPVAIVDASSNQTVRTLACQGCGEPNWMTWSKQGTQLLVVRQDPDSVELWDGATGKLERKLPFSPPSPFVDAVALWTVHGPMVITTHEREAECDPVNHDCEWDEDDNPMPYLATDFVGWTWSADGSVNNSVDLGSDLGSFDALSLDPEGRWVMWTTSLSYDRDGENTVVNVVGSDGSSSGMTWDYWEDGGGEGYYYDESRTPSWRNDGSVEWLIQIERAGYEYERAWEGCELLPEPRCGAGTIAGGYEDELEIELQALGLVDGELISSGTICQDGRCDPIGLVPPRGCEPLDLGPDGHVGLLGCGDDLFLWWPSSDARPQPLKLPHAEAQWVWGRSGWLAVQAERRLVLLDPRTGKIGLDRNDVILLHDLAMSAEVELLLAETDEGVDLIDARRGETRIQVIEGTATQIALSQAGDRIVVLDTEIRVIELGEGKTLTRWELPEKTLRVAFRQDGEVVYGGPGRPTHAWDASTGQLLEDDQTLGLLAQLDDTYGELDPTWRWILDEGSTTITRTLDGQALRLAREGAVMSELGLFEGQAMPGVEVGFRVGTDAWALPEYTANDLKRWLERPGLAKAFLLGAEIRPPTITAAELEGVRAAREAKQSSQAPRP